MKFEDEYTGYKVLLSESEDSLIKNKNPIYDLGSSKLDSLLTSRNHYNVDKTPYAAFEGSFSIFFEPRGNYALENHRRQSQMNSTKDNYILIMKKE